MRRMLSCFAFIAISLMVTFAPLTPLLAQDYAADKAEAVDTQRDALEEKAHEAAATTKEAVQKLGQGLGADLKKAREALLGNDDHSDNPFARGFLIALFQPIFMASMFCLGLWAGQMHERLSSIWVMPVFAYVATVVGAFIAVYHSDWKPQFDEGLMSQFQNTDAVTLVIGLLIGAAVGMRFLAPSLIAIAGVIIAGLGLGFSQTTDVGAHHNALLPFWAGFGLTGLLVNIFGIGFETFLESSRLQAVTRFVGVATLFASFILVAKIL